MLKSVCIFHVQILKHKSLLMQSIILFNTHFVCDELLSYFFFYLTWINMSVTCLPFHKSVMNFPELKNEVSVLSCLSAFSFITGWSKDFLACIYKHLIIVFVKVYKATSLLLIKFFHPFPCIARCSHKISLCFLTNRLFDEGCQSKINQHNLPPTRTVQDIFRFNVHMYYMKLSKFRKFFVHFL